MIIIAEWLHIHRITVYAINIYALVLWDVLSHRAVDNCCYMYVAVPEVKKECVSLWSETFLNARMLTRFQ